MGQVSPTEGEVHVWDSRFELANNIYPIHVEKNSRIPYNVRREPQCEKGSSVVIDVSPVCKLETYWITLVLSSLKPEFTPSENQILRYIDWCKVEC